MGEIIIIKKKGVGVLQATVDYTGHLDKLNTDYKSLRHPLSHLHQTDIVLTVRRKQAVHHFSGHVQLSPPYIWSGNGPQLSDQLVHISVDATDFTAESIHNTIYIVLSHNDIMTFVLKSAPLIGVCHQPYAIVTEGLGAGASVNSNIVSI